MADQRLVDYIKENLARGYSVDYLMQLLIDQGWDIGELNEAVSTAHGHDPAPPRPPEAPHPPAASKPATQNIQPAQGIPRRPAGVTIISLFGFLGSAAMLALGALMIIFGGIVSALPGAELLNATGGEGSPGLSVISFAFGLFGIWYGIVQIIISAIGLFSYYLLWKMKKAGWMLIIAWTLIGLVAAVFMTIMMMPVLAGMMAVSPGFPAIFLVSALLPLAGSAVFLAVIFVYLYRRRKLFA